MRDEFAALKLHPHLQQPQHTRRDCSDDIDLFTFVPAVKFIPIAGRVPAIPAILSAFRVSKSTRQINDKAYHQNQAKPAAADDGTAEVKPAATKQEKQNNDD
jgi:hypothetical protein